MNKSELVEIIREVVRTELRSVGPSLVREALIESLQSGGNVISVEEEAPFVAEASEAKPEPSKIVEQRKIKKPLIRIPGNPALQKILNETEGGVPQDSSVPLVAEMGSTPSVLDTIKNAPKEVLAENTAVAAVASALTKDYRSILKASMKKSEEKRR